MTVAVATARVARTIQGIQKGVLFTVRWHWGGRGSCGGDSAGGQDDSGNSKCFFLLCVGTGKSADAYAGFHALMISWE